MCVCVYVRVCVCVSVSWSVCLRHWSTPLPTRDDHHVSVCCSLRIDLAAGILLKLSIPTQGWCGAGFWHNSCHHKYFTMISGTHVLGHTNLTPYNCLVRWIMPHRLHLPRWGNVYHPFHICRTRSWPEGLQSRPNDQIRSLVLGGHEISSKLIFVYQQTLMV